MRSLTVLLAEDEPIISLHIQSLLEAKGLRVIQATEQHAILQACEQFHPNLALLNYKHQDSSDGMALAQMLKQRFMLPVILVTGARPQDMEASEAFDSGIAILYKPFTRTQLRQFVHRWLA